MMVATDFSREDLRMRLQAIVRQIMGGRQRSMVLHFSWRPLPENLSVAMQFERLPWYNERTHEVVLTSSDRIYRHSVLQTASAPSLFRQLNFQSAPARLQQI